MRKFKSVLALTAALVCLCVTGTALAETYRAIVTAGSMTVYADEARTWPMGALPGAAVVTVKEKKDGTAKISVSGGVGYVKASELTAIDDLAERAVFSTDSRVYRTPSLSSAWLAVPEGMELNLLAVSGPWAMVENGGVVAYTNAAHLTVVTPEDECDDDQGGKIVTETFEADVTADAARVYSGADERSGQVGALPKGARVTVYAYNDRWAYIGLDAARGFVKLSCLTRAREDYINNEKLSVEERIYMFLRREMELNDAVACGILANVEKECGFRVTAASYDGGVFPPMEDFLHHLRAKTYRCRKVC